ncbi:hypothetical protein QBC39DRAFT_9356 [Podospora conica]|nr:hypothetical protein QBC39DRAFT_9356 [Schizothecium conicum]
MHPRPIHDPINRPNPRHLRSDCCLVESVVAANPSAPVGTPDCHTRHTRAHTHMAHGHFTHSNQNEPACLKNRSSDETRARLNHRNSPRAELAWRQGRGGPFFPRPRHRKSDGLRKRNGRRRRRPKRCPAPPNARPSPPPRRRGAVAWAPVRGASERQNAGPWRRSRTTPHGKGGNWGLGGAEGEGGRGALVRGTSHRRHVSSPPPHPSFSSPHQPPFTPLSGLVF